MTPMTTPADQAHCSPAPWDVRLMVWVMCIIFVVLPAIPAPAQETSPKVAEDQLEVLVAVPDKVADPEADKWMSDSVTNVVTADNYGFTDEGRKIFNPNPERAVWLSALCPGLGQIYNRRYWKLPIVVGGFMGLGYATNWNNDQFQDYTQAYRDLLDSDPNTNSYMDFFPPNTTESELDKSWLQTVMKSRKDYYRRNRDLCIICLVALYLLCMVDAYVDASLAHFDISSDLSMDLQPAIFREGARHGPAVGLQWAFNF